MKTVRVLLFATLTVVALAFSFSNASACGGLFCQNIPVDQSAERIIFNINRDGTITAMVNINYTGSAPNFAWVVPVPTPPDLDVGDMTTIMELDQLTQPQYVAPPNDCPIFAMPAMSADSTRGGGVTVFSQGSVGPYNYAVIGGSDASELVAWLKENQYRVLDSMIPLMQPYASDGMVFLAMKLQPEKNVQDIAPVKMTYKSIKPMIPLRLTAVAANPNMGVLTWIFAPSQMEAENYQRLKIKEDDIVFQLFGGHNYLQLVADENRKVNGHGFVTEYAAPTKNLNASDPALQKLFQGNRYLTRFYTRINPEEMTIDPVFRANAALPNVSNLHDLSNDPRRVWDCNTFSNRVENIITGTVTKISNTVPRESQPLAMAIVFGAVCIGAAVLVGAGGLIWARRKPR